jgi:5'-3' exonuclease
MKYIILDISNLLYRSYYANKNEDELTIAGLAQHQALLTLNKYYRKFNPDKIVMAFDRKAWRIDYTTSELCLSGKKYKGNRRKDMTEKEQAKYKAFLEHLNQFEELMRVHTSVICLAADGLEADDLVAGFVQQFAGPENEIIAVSTDKDYIQILGHENVRLIDPATDKDRTLEEWGGDAKLFMFEKCIRGDAGDNVQSAYPRVRKTRIMKAWEEPIERVNMMEETWTNHEGRVMVVKEVFKENELLMDLSKQPQEVRDLMTKTINENMENPGKFSLMQFMQFLGKFEMNKVADNITTYAEMLSR